MQAKTPIGPLVKLSSVPTVMDSPVFDFCSQDLIDAPSFDMKTLVVGECEFARGECYLLQEQAGIVIYAYGEDDKVSTPFAISMNEVLHMRALRDTAALHFVIKFSRAAEWLAMNGLDMMVSQSESIIIFVEFTDAIFEDVKTMMRRMWTMFRSQSAASTRLSVVQEPIRSTARVSPSMAPGAASASAVALSKQPGEAASTKRVTVVTPATPLPTTPLGAEVPADVDCGSRSEEAQQLERRSHTPPFTHARGLGAKSKRGDLSSDDDDEGAATDATTRGRRAPHEPQAAAKGRGKAVTQVVNHKANPREASPPRKRKGADVKARDATASAASKTESGLGTTIASAAVAAAAAPSSPQGPTLADFLLGPNAKRAPAATTPAAATSRDLPKTEKKPLMPQRAANAAATGFDAAGAVVRKLDDIYDFGSIDFTTKASSTSTTGRSSKKATKAAPKRAPAPVAKAAPAAIKPTVVEGAENAIVTNPGATVAKPTPPTPIATSHAARVRSALSMVPAAANGAAALHRPSIAPLGSGSVVMCAPSIAPADVNDECAASVQSELQRMLSRGIGAEDLEDFMAKSARLVEHKRETYRRRVQEATVAIAVCEKVVRSCGQTTADRRAAAVAATRERFSALLRNAELVAERVQECRAYVDQRLHSLDKAAMAVAEETRALTEAFAAEMRRLEEGERHDYDQAVAIVREHFGADVK